MVKAARRTHFFLKIAAFISLAFLATSANAQIAPTKNQISTFNPFQLAAHKGDVATLQKLVKSTPDINHRDSYGRTALMIATFARKPRAIELLIDAGAKTGLLENDRYDAVTIAAVADFPEIVALLLKKGASAKLVTSIYDGTALIAAAHLGHDEVVRHLIKAGAPLDHVNNLKWTALIEAIVLGNGQTRHIETVRALVDAGANVNLPDGQAKTPLQLAQARGYVAIIDILKKAGAR